MSIISKPYTFSAGATVIASEHNSNWDTLLSDYNGNINNSNISGSAAITYSKLNLATSIVDADVNASAGIVGTKLDLTSVGAIGSVARNSGAFTVFSMGTTRQGDILYDNGTSIIRLAAGTSGNFLQTLGPAANPQWAVNAPLPSHSEFLARLTNDATTPATYDLTSGYTTGTDFATNTFTAPVTGKYFFNATAYVTKDGTATARTITVNIRKGGAVVATSTGALNTTSAVGSTQANIVLNLTVADTIDVTLTAPSCTFTSNDITKSYFCGFLIR